MSERRSPLCDDFVEHHFNWCYIVVIQRLPFLLQVFNTKIVRSANLNMSQIREVLPKQGQIYDEDLPTMVLCKPKLLPLKSVTLEKLEKMQREAEDQIRQQDLAESQREKDMFGHAVSEPSVTNTTPGEIEQEPDRLVL